jgi:DNA-binding response OmpR family regulator
MMRAWMVDDDEDMSQALKMMLKLLGFDLRIFPNARFGAQALLTEELPALLFIDLNMPEVTGIDLLTYIRSKPRWDKLPIIMLSAESADVTVDDAMQRGADAYLCKPVSMGELKAGIAQAYHKRKNMTP